MLTDAEVVYLDWGKPTEHPIRRTSAAAQARMPFAAGSMGSKVEAACRFVAATGKRAAIGALRDLSRIMWTPKRLPPSTGSEGRPAGRGRHSSGFAEERFDEGPTRRMSLLQATMLVTGNMIGTGVCLLPVNLALVGGIAILGFLVATVGAAALGLIFAKLGELDPQEGGPYAYARDFRSGVKERAPEHRRAEPRAPWRGQLLRHR